MGQTRFILREKQNAAITVFNFGMRTYMLSKLIALPEAEISNLHNKYKTSTLMDLTKRVRFLQHTDIYKLYDAYKLGNVLSELKNISNVKDFTKELKKKDIFSGSLTIDLIKADQLTKIAFEYLMLQDPEKFTQVITEDPKEYSELIKELNLDPKLTAGLAPKIKK